MQLRLRELRELHGLKQAEVAEIINCSPSAYSKYERGIRAPHYEDLRQLSALYNVSVDYLIGNSFVEANALSDYERTLIGASREVPAHVKYDVLDFLKMKKISEPDQMPE